MTEIKVKSLGKALDILECFIYQDELGVTEIADKLGLIKSNVHNILSTFHHYGYLEQSPANSKYHLGIKVMDLYRAVGDRYSIRSIAKPFMQEIANITQEQVFLAVPNNNQVLYLEASYPATDLSLSRSLTGITAPFYCTAIGKAMLAGMTKEYIDEYIKHPRQAFTENTLLTDEELIAELRLIQNMTYAVDNMEHEYGVKCVAKAIKGKDGMIVGAISITGPSLRFDSSTISNYAELLNKYVEIIQEKI